MFTPNCEYEIAVRGPESGLVSGSSGASECSFSNVRETIWRVPFFRGRAWYCRYKGARYRIWGGIRSPLWIRVNP